MILRLLLFLLLCPLAAAAGEMTLYDPGLSQLPSEQPWLDFFSFRTSSQSPEVNGVNFVTTLETQAGYSNYKRPLFQQTKNSSFPVLDRTKGIALFFELQVHSETHESNDRAGFSIILLSKDKKGVEIGFWLDEIWAQTDTPQLFIHGESVEFDTTSELKQYKLTVEGDNYSLFHDESLILNGDIKDYSSFNGPFNPYILENYLFLGDDTTSAAADITLGRVTLQTGNFPWSLFLPLLVKEQRVEKNP